MNNNNNNNINNLQRQQPPWAFDFNDDTDHPDDSPDSFFLLDRASLNTNTTAQAHPPPAYTPNFTALHPPAHFSNTIPRPLVRSPAFSMQPGIHFANNGIRPPARNRPVSLRPRVYFPNTGQPNRAPSFPVLHPHPAPIGYRNRALPPRPLDRSRASRPPRRFFYANIPPRTLDRPPSVPLALFSNPNHADRDRLRFTVIPTPPMRDKNRPKFPMPSSSSSHATIEPPPIQNAPPSPNSSIDTIRPAQSSPPPPVNRPFPPDSSPSPPHDAPITAPDLYTNNQQLCCRICREEATPEMPLYTPCKCTGSIQHVHQSCLLEWLLHSGGNERCEVCGEKFMFVSVYSHDMPSRLPLMIVLRNALFSVSMMAVRVVRVTVVMHIWFMGVPALIGWSTKKLFMGLPSPNVLVAGYNTPVFGPRNKPKPPLGQSWVPSFFPSGLIEWQLITLMTMILAMFVLFLRDWVVRIYREAVVNDAWRRRRRREIRRQQEEALANDRNAPNPAAINDNHVPHQLDPAMDIDLPPRQQAAQPVRPVPAPPVINNIDDDDDVPLQGGIDDMLGLAGPIDQGIYALFMALAVLGMSVVALQWAPYLVGCAFLALRPGHWTIVVAQGLVQLTDTAAERFVGATAQYLAELSETVAATEWEPIVRKLVSNVTFQAGYRHIGRYRDVMFHPWLVYLIDMSETVHYVQLDTWGKRYAVVALGWIVASVLFAGWAWVCQVHNTRAELAWSLIRRAIVSMSGTAKLVLFIAIEWAIFPAYTGTLVHVLIYPVAAQNWAASELFKHWAWAQSHPGSAFVAHWIMGANVMFYQSSFVQASRQILRPGVLWFVRDVSDPDFSPYADIAAKSLPTLIRKIGLSAFVYSLVTAVTTLTIRMILWATLGPLRTPNVTLYSAPVDIVILGAVSPWIAGRLPVFEIAQYILLCALDLLGRALRLRSFLFGGFHVDETDAGTGGRSVVTRVLKSFANPKVLVRPRITPLSGLGRNHPVLVAARQAEAAGATRFSTDYTRMYAKSSPGLYRVPAYDMVPVDHEPKQMLFPVNSNGVDLIFPQRSLGQTTPALNQDHWTYVYLPSMFTVRWMMLLLGVVVMLGVFIAMVIATPIYVGREMFPLIVYRVFGAKTVVLKDRVHDIYAWVLGAFVAALMSAFVVYPVRDLWANDGRAVTWPRTFGTWVWVLTLAGILFPVLVGRILAVVFSVAVNHELKVVVVNVQGIQHVAWQWCVGIVVMQLALFSYENANPNGPIMNRIARAFPNGNPDFRRVNEELLFPLVHRLLPIAVLRHATVLVLRYMHATADDDKVHSMHATWLVMCSLGCVYFVRKGAAVVSEWLQGVRDREYQVTRVLQNRALGPPQ